MIFHAAGERYLPRKGNSKLLTGLKRLGVYFFETLRYCRACIRLRVVNEGLAVDLWMGGINGATIIRDFYIFPFTPRVAEIIGGFQDWTRRQRAVISRAAPTRVIDPRTAVAKSLTELSSPITIQKNKCSPIKAPMIP